MRGSTSTGVAMHFAPRKATFGHRMYMPSFNTVLLGIIAATLGVIAVELRSPAQINQPCTLNHESAIDMIKAREFKASGGGAASADAAATTADVATTSLANAISADADVTRELVSRPTKDTPVVGTAVAEDEALVDNAADDDAAREERGRITEIKARSSAVFEASSPPKELNNALTSSYMEAATPRRRLTADCSCWGSGWSGFTLGSTSACYNTNCGSIGSCSAVGYLPSCSVASSLTTLSSTVAAHTSALSCASGRRLEEEEPAAISSEETTEDYLLKRLTFVGSLTSEQLAHFEELEQLFGLPAHA